MENTENTRGGRKKDRWSIKGVRYIFTLLGFFGYFTTYAVRVNMNVAIVAMVNASAIYSKGKENETTECSENLPHFLKNGTGETPLPDGDFIWYPDLQASVIGAFYYGYFISQVPGGRLAEMFSAKWVFGVGTGFTALLTLLTPLAARLHVGCLIFIRAVEGLSQGVTQPAMFTLMGRWLPDCEKGLLSSIIHAGITMGPVITMPVVGVICQSTSLGGWPSAFYVVGIFGCVWFLFWIWLAADSPAKNPYITQAELKYITCNQQIDQNVELPPIPWLKIAKSVPFWALLFTQVGSDWAFYTLVNDLPTFFDTILHLKIQTNGFLSSFPFLINTAVGALVAFVFDILLRRGTTSTNFVRKFCNTVACVGMAAGLTGVCFAGCDVTLQVTFFTIAMTLGGFYTCSFPLSYLDMSPEYAGTLMGITNTISNLAGFLAPQVVGSLTKNSQTLYQWQIVFAISIIFLLSCSAIYGFFITVEKQPWVDQDPLLLPSSLDLDNSDPITDKTEEKKINS